MRDILKTAIVIPLTAALCTGVFVLALALPLAAWRGWPSVYALIVAAGAALVAWLGWSARFASIIERRISPPPPPDVGPKEINLRLHQEQGEYLTGVYLDNLPISAADLANLARLAMAGGSLTTSTMTGSGLDRRTWEALRDKLIAGGLLAWRGGSRVHGLEVTNRGRRVFARLIDPGA